MRARLTHLLALAAVLACGTEDPLALDEPLVVQQGDFKDGPLPGTLAAPGTPPNLPAITSFTLGFGVLRPGTRGAQVSGRATKEAYSVGVRFADQGSGYWVRPVGAEDPLIPGELQWQLALDAASAIEPGLHALEVVAFDAQGRPGTRTSLPVCIASELPDNLNVCNPKTEPPFAIATLHWDADSDVDLTAVAPDGTPYGRSKRSLLSGSKVLARLDGDGVSGCLADGRRIESFAWNEPVAGTWRLYANLFDACGKASVHFTLTLYARKQSADGTFSLEEIKRIDGELVRAQANGGAGSPLFLTELKL